MEVGKKVGHCVGNARLYGDLPLLYGALYGDLPLFLRAHLPISCKSCLSYRVSFFTGPAQKISKYGTGPAQKRKIT